MRTTIRIALGILLLAGVACSSMEENAEAEDVGMVVQEVSTENIDCLVLPHGTRRNGSCDSGDSDVETITFYAPPLSDPKWQYRWKVQRTEDLAARLLPREQPAVGCGGKDDKCTIKIYPGCDHFLLNPGTLNPPREYTATVKIGPSKFDTRRELTAHATVFNRQCLGDAEAVPSCDVPPSMPAWSYEEECGGRYAYEFSQVQGATRYEGFQTQYNWDWSTGRQEFNCDANATPDDADFRITVGGVKRKFRFHACNACGCSEWSNTVFMQNAGPCE